MALASRGAREIGGVRSMIDGEEEIALFRRRARGVYLRTFLSTLGLMLAGRAWLWWRG